MHRHQGDAPGTTREVLVSRQAIYTPQLDVMAYTLLFHSGAGEPVGGAPDYQATAQGLLTSVLDIGLDALVGPRPAFLPLTRGFMLLGYATVFPPDRVVLALPAHLMGDSELHEGLREMSAQGYRIALADNLVHAPLPPLVEQAAYLIFDVSSIDHHTLQERVVSLRRYPFSLVAQQVQTWEDFQYCRDLGFSYFHGAFVSQPDILKGSRLPTNRLALLRLLTRLQEPLITLDVLSDLISQDVTLSYRLLRAINAASYGLSRPITRLQQAVRLLGITSITHWISMMLLSGIHDKPPELLTLALVRGKMCEHLAHTLAQDDTSSSFLVGLFSVLDALLDRPMSEVLQALPLAEELRSALLEHTGSLGTILHGVLAYERGNWQEAMRLGLNHASMLDAYRHAIAWTAGIIDTLTGV